MLRSIATALAGALLLTMTVAAAPAAADTSRPKAASESALVQEINRERSRAGLPALQVTIQQQRKAREHSQLMRDTDHLHHPSSLAAEIFPSDAWAGIGENVARSRSLDRAHRNLMDSPPHRANILGDWTHVAVGVAYDGADIWVTQRFVRVRPGRSLPMFRDMPSSAWKRETVQRAWRRELLNGCGNDRVCADDRLSRAQMASLIARAAGYQERSALSARFVDVSGRDVHAGNIGALVEHGVTNGCRTERFCPSDSVSRAETASLISRSRGWSADDRRRFSDVAAAHTHFGTINRLAERGVTNGCATERYCPSRPVSRVEAARMLDVAF